MIAGDMVPWRCSWVIRAAAPAATGSEVPGAGHWLLEERPDRVVAEVNAFYPPA